MKSDRHYDVDGKPYEGRDEHEILMKWARDMEDGDKKVVRKTFKLWGLVTISSVWLGLDHSWGEGKPLIYETMIFIGGWAVEYQWRFSTKEELIKHHDELLRTFWYMQFVYLWRKVTEKLFRR